MKTLLALTIAVVLVVGSASFVLAGDFNKYGSKICTFFDDFGLKHGACVSTFQACVSPGEGAFPELCICKFLRAAYPDDYNDIVGNNGLGACVQFIRDLP